ncbi:class I SAM-dependent methyltransferase [Pelagibius litoralis]|uniref:Class I SAM-dependent methyltransferase n=1 Tax=Pelagibius litoralis TaxID=374515 RepID=A0A967F2R6_9PROT|nr:SAM-dependent methyltransferase [Pelagibius litoralis]NIA71942.1 class I SAM-dependent methyltransferase [Pelagibius litoralis]
MPLIDEIVKRIERQGPLSIADYMALCLTHPTEGYYMKGDPFGAPRATGDDFGGDFVTAPEISQMFGELIGLWLADCWLRLGSPSPCLLVELGPGRGTLMADVLRACRAVPDFLEAADIQLVEVSPSLRRIQRENLPGQAVTWIDSLAELPDAPFLLVANEFFDALAIRQFEKTAAGWAERRVGLAENGRSLAFGLAAASPVNAALIPDNLRSAETGSIVELCPAGLSLAAFLGARLAHQPGAALVIDYGAAESQIGPTLQALRQHRRQDVLQAPGQADLTAHVDFHSLAAAASAAGARAFGPVDQGAFLQTLGIETRAAHLAAAAPAQAASIKAARHRLVDPAEMGSLFKALALVSPVDLAPDLTPPAGFAVD